MIFIIITYHKAAWSRESVGKKKKKKETYEFWLTAASWFCPLWPQQYLFGCFIWIPLIFVGNGIPWTEVVCCETCLQNDERALKQTHHSPPFSSPFSQFWLGPLNILLLKDQTYFCFEVCLALNKHGCVWGMTYSSWSNCGHWTYIWCKVWLDT